MIQKCLDADPLKRQTAEGLHKKFSDLWFKSDKKCDDSYEENSIINQQIREADEINKQLLPLTTPFTDILSYYASSSNLYK